MPESREYDVIVVGAGFGGSTCAALLAKHGLNVLLLDKNTRAGGKAMSISKNGFTHTAWLVLACPVTDNLFQFVLKELGLENSVKLIPPQSALNVYKNSKDEYIPLSVEADKAIDPNTVFDWLEVADKDRDESLRLMTEITLMDSQNIDALDDISLSEFLGRYNIPRQVYSFLISACADPMFIVPADALCASEAIRTMQDVFLHGGGLSCEGGWGNMAEALVHAVRQNNGTAIMDTRVERIAVDNGRVTGVATNRGFFRAPIVVSNAGIQPTVLKLVDKEHWDSNYVNTVRGLKPSFGFMGARYFLSREVTSAVTGSIFSSDSAWSQERFVKARRGDAPKIGGVYFEVPSNADPSAAPKGKQMLMSGYWCPSDPNMSAKEMKEWDDAAEGILFEVLPDLRGSIEHKELYTTRHVSNLTRDHVLPDQGGECIGLAQVVGQSGNHKPSFKAPLQGLFYVGCDAGGQGIGIHQATDSGINVANYIRHHSLVS